MNNEILIIDDSIDSRFILKQKALRLGYNLKVHEACNGKEAIQLLLDYDTELAKKPSGEGVSLLIFLDVNMPVMNGFDFMEEYTDLSTKFQKINPTVIFMISSSENPIDIDKANEIEKVQEFILKYPSKESLKKIFDDAFELNKKIKQSA